MLRSRRRKRPRQLSKVTEYDGISAIARFLEQQSSDKPRRDDNARLRGLLLLYEVWLNCNIEFAL